MRVRVKVRVRGKARVRVRVRMRVRVSAGEPAEEDRGPERRDQPAPGQAHVHLRAVAGQG